MEGRVFGSFVHVEAGANLQYLLAHVKLRFQINISKVPYEDYSCCYSSIKEYSHTVFDHVALLFGLDPYLPTVVALFF